MSGINDSFFKRNINIISNNQSSKTKSISLKTITFDEIVPKNRNIDTKFLYCVGKYPTKYNELSIILE